MLTQIKKKKKVSIFTQKDITLISEQRFGPHVGVVLGAEFLATKLRLILQFRVQYHALFENKIKKLI